MAKPLLDLHCIEEQYCDYPVALKVTMDDGTVQTYVLQNQTSYQFEEVMKSVKKITVGYQYKPEKRRSRLHRGKL